MSQAMPIAAIARMTYHVGSNSHQKNPLRAARWKRWWLLCQPSPAAKIAVITLLRESSRVSNRREPIR